ncbi:helix-turn-helix transcriptional regulator [Nonomuraea sp. NPDC004297]
MAAVPPPLVGRARELERLEAALACAPSVVVVEGEAGIGKSRLVAELAARSSRRFLIGGCAQVREPFPLGPIVEALRGRGADVAGTPLSPVAGSLRPLLPELGDVLPEAPPALDDRAAERHRLFRGLTEVLSALGPAVLVVEDLHWADELTVEFLTYLVTVLPHGLSVVLTYRGEEAGAAVRSVTSRAASTVTADSLTLPPLDVAETRALAAAILETEQVSTEFAEHLRSRASGLPLAVQELLALLRSRGTLIRWEGGWARRALDSLDVPAGVRASVQERVAHLPQRARAVVEAAAVLRLAVPLSVLAEVANLDEEPAAAGADEALASGLLVERDGLVEFRHTLSAQAAYAAITLGRRQAMHARAATAVGALHPVPYGQIAHHLRGAGRITDWVAATATAADRALALGDGAEAVRLLEDVLRHAPLDPVRRAELSTRLGRAARATGRVRAIGDLLAEALGHDLPRTVRGELRLELALHIDLTRTDQLRVRQAFADAIEDLGDRPELAAWAMVGLGIPTTADRPLAERVAWLERALDTLPQDGDGGLRLFVLGKVAMVFAVAGDPRWSELTGRVLREAGDEPVSRQVARAYKSIAAGAVASGHHGAAYDLLSTALAGLRESGSPDHDKVRLRCELASARYYRGDWAGLRAEIEALREHYADLPHHRTVLDGLAACLAPAAGRDALIGIIRAAGVRGDLDTLPAPVAALLRLDTARGDPGAAVAETAGVFASWERRDLWPVGVRAVPAAVEALLAAQDEGGAADMVRRYGLGVRGLDAPLAVPALAHARGLLAAGAERWAEAATEFAAAATAYAALPAAHEAALATERRAACLFALGDPSAEECVRQAIAAYTALGADWNLDRVTGLARGWGIRPAAPRRSPGADGGLSARQLQVARLAAAGMTNQEIARQLFLSPKTVDKHVSAAMRKAGARSRTELARHLPS